MREKLQSAYQLTLSLQMDYKTVRYHLHVLQDNHIIITAGGKDMPDEDALEGDNEGLRLGKILLRLSDCMDKVKKTKGLPPFFEFNIPRET